MRYFWYYLHIFVVFKLASPETSIEIEVSNHLSSLEDEVHFPINVYMSGLGILLENLVTNFSNYQLDANEVIETYAIRIKDDVESVSLSDLGIETDCDETVEDNIKHILKTNDESIKKIVFGGITKAQRIISEAKNVFLLVQNRTTAVKQKVEHCLSLLDDTECLFETLTSIVLMERTVPKIISTIGHQHQFKLSLLEDDVVSGIKKVVVKVFDSLVEILDDFLICSLTEEHLM